jgi:hypothetical protein
VSTVVIISDSHGLIRPEIEPVLKTTDHVIHAGDVGSDEILQRFLDLNDRIVFVRGNVDRDERVNQLPESVTLEIGGYRIHMVHNINELLLERDPPDFVVYGHSHMPAEEMKGETRYVNPGSIGPRRFSIPISYASLDLDGDPVSLQFHTIDP